MVLSRNVAVSGRAGAVLTALTMTSTSLAGTPQLDSQYAAPAINRDVFKEGAVRRTEASFENWRVVCDEVTAERRRFCSLFGSGKTVDGSMVGGIVVTTTREGRPAAMLHLPYGVALRAGVTIAATPGLTAAGSRRDKNNRPVKLVFVLCDTQGCMTLWPLTAAQLNALMTGGTLTVRFKSMTVARMAGPTPVLAGAAEREMAISGLGFSEAVKASLANP
jgi:invasion protein IalB